MRQVEWRGQGTGKEGAVGVPPTPADPRGVVELGAGEADLEPWVGGWGIAEMSHHDL